MSAMSANFAVAPAHVRSTAAIRRAGRASAKRVIARGVKAEAVKEAVALDTTKSDQVRLLSHATRCAARIRPLARSELVSRASARSRPSARFGIREAAYLRRISTTHVETARVTVGRARRAASPRAACRPLDRTCAPRSRPRAPRGGVPRPRASRATACPPAVVDPAGFCVRPRKTTVQACFAFLPPLDFSPRAPTADRASDLTTGRPNRSQTHFFPVITKQIFKAAQDILPGGVNSPVRAFKSVGGGPIVFDHVKDAYAFDVDGNKYIDYVGSWGPAICGHANERVNEKLKAQIDKGTSFGAPCELENVLGQMVIDRVPSVEMVRFCNSGTEACLSVLRVMRAYTGRDKIIKFEGCYHGHADPFLVQAGSGVATLGLPDSPGVPKAATNTTLCAPYNDLEAVKKIFEENKGEIAGVILEPVVGNSGFIVPDKSFLEGLRELTTAEGALLTFDEVMTGFRISKGCAQEYWGVTPDLTTMGKVIGGGLPVGAYGGKREIMDVVAPAGPMYQAGTLSGNPLAMVAGIETLEILAEEGSYDYMDANTKRLIEGILAAGKEAGHAVCGGSIRGMFGFFFCEGPVRNFADATESDTDKFARWHRGMLEEGVYLAPSQYEAGFTGLKHTEEDIDFTIEAAKRVMARI